MKNLSSAVVVIVASATFANAQYQHGWKNYKKAQPGDTYGTRETNPYGPGQCRFKECLFLGCCLQ